MPMTPPSASALTWTPVFPKGRCGSVAPPLATDERASSAARVAADWVTAQAAVNDFRNSRRLSPVHDGSFMVVQRCSFTTMYGVSLFKSGWMRPLPSLSIASMKYIRSQVEGMSSAGMTVRYWSFTPVESIGRVR